VLWRIDSLFIASLSLLLNIKIKSHSFIFYFFFFLLLTFDGGGGFCNYFDSWKIEEARFFSLTPLTLFFFHSFTLTLSLLSLSQELINLSYTLYTCNSFNRIDLDFTVPKIFSLIHSAQVMSHISTLSHSLVIELMCHMTWAFFCPFFRSHHERANYHIRSREWVSEWELIIKP
jgi:hypothetical protein